MYTCKPCTRISSLSNICIYLLYQWGDHDNCYWIVTKDIYCINVYINIQKADIVNLNYDKIRPLKDREGPLATLLLIGSQQQHF